MSLSLETASLFPGTVALSLVAVAGFVEAVAEDSVLSLLQPPEVASLFLETASLFLVLVAAPVEVASEAVDILFFLVEGIAVFL